ncbi:MAG: hypothetical protein PHP50_09200 [Lachnospiraceae bacterium]|nr:hypothetical protein [Lachnospiraceae bacterium]
MSALAKPAYYDNATAEYEQAHMMSAVMTLQEKDGLPDIPLILITHSSALAEKETMEFGGATLELARKVETIWQELMKEYLLFSKNSTYIEADKSTHYIHLTQPELITQALEIIKN